MKNLHTPKDPTTEFLSLLCHPAKTKQCNRWYYEIRIEGIDEIHDRILILGHGFQYDWLIQGNFQDRVFIMTIHGSYSEGKITWHFICVMRRQYARTNCFIGLSSACLSLQLTSILYGYEDIDSDLIEQSKGEFAAIMSKCDS
jgi:hypothetical protein